LNQGRKNVIFAKGGSMQWVKIFSSEKEARERLEDKRLQLLIVHGHRICLALYQQTFFAVQDACSHNSESLSKGAVNHLGEVICPWHNYRFNLQSGRECTARSADLKTYPVRAEADGFYIGIY
jgi:nitrite reductase/ring-hydroxylating ferredoxin subunit